VPKFPIYQQTMNIISIIIVYSWLQRAASSKIIIAAIIMSYKSRSNNAAKMEIQHELAPCDVWFHTASPMTQNFR
jgi:hypothetical protein